MPARMMVCAAALALAACVSDTPAESPDLPPLTAPDIRERADQRAEEGRRRGFPDLSRVPGRTELVPSAEQLNAERGTLEEEAAQLKLMREAAARSEPPDDLRREAAALRAAVARDRAVQAAQEPIAAPPPPRETQR